MQEEDAYFGIDRASGPQNVWVLETDPCAVFAVLHQVAAMEGDGGLLDGCPCEKFDGLSGFVRIDDSCGNSLDQFGRVRFTVFPVGR